MLQDNFNKAVKRVPAETDDVFGLRAARDAALKAAQAAIRDTTRLTRLFSILSDPAPLPFLLDRALSTLSELFAADIVVLLDPAGTGSFSPLAAIGLPEDMIHQSLSEAESGYAAASMRGKTPILSTQANTDPNVDPQLRQLGAETIVWVPVVDTRVARGVLILARCRPFPFSHADAGILAAMAYRIGLALEQDQHRSQLEQIVRTSREIAHLLDESALGAELVRMFPALMRADAAALVLHDPAGVPYCVSRFGIDAALDSAWSSLCQRLLTDSCLASGQPYRTPDLHATAEQFSLEALKYCPVRVLLAVPIRRAERVQGLLYAMRLSTWSFSPDAVQIATIYAGQASAALENARLYRAVRESEHRFATAFQWSPLSITLTSLPEGKFIDVNDTFQRSTGYTRDEVIGRAYSELGLFVDLDVLAAIRAQLIDQGQVYAKECRIKTKSGSILTCLISISIVSINGRQCSLGSVINITARKQAELELEESEERLKLALTGADLGMWDWNVVTGEFKFNERWAEMLGYSVDEIAPHVRAWEKLIHPDDMSRVKEVLNAHLEGVTPHYETEHRFITKSGKCIWVLVKGKVTHRDDQGRSLRVAGTYLDITEAKQIERERHLMEQQKQQLWRAESLGRMAGGIAHHFNNLLGIVMGNIELAQADLPKGTHARLSMTEAMKASRRAAEISHLMLAYLGQTTLQKKLLDLAQATREVIPLLIASVPTNVHIKAELPRRGPIILADGVHIKQILTNLVSNSMEAIGEREGEIVVQIGVTDAGEMRASRFFPLDWEPRAQRYGWFSVCDTGCGLDEATIARIFDPFFSTKFVGRGLGLSVVLGLVRAHKGAISVESRPNQWTAFRLFFPEQEQEALPCSKKEVPASAGLKSEGLVLLVDDEPMFRLMCSAQLKRLGYEVIEACDGLDAVEKFRARKDEFRLVLLDLSMPRMDGWETLAILRATRPGIAVILASGYDRKQAMRNDCPEQPQAFLQKPYQRNELKEAIAEALGSTFGR